MTPASVRSRDRRTEARTDCPGPQHPPQRQTTSEFSRCDLTTAVGDPLTASSGRPPKGDTKRRVLGSSCFTKLQVPSSEKGLKMHVQPKKERFCPEKQSSAQMSRGRKTPKKPNTRGGAAGRMFFGFAVLRALPTQTEGRTRNTHAVWPWTSLLTLTDLEERGPTRWARSACWQHHELQRKRNEKSVMCLTCLIALVVDSVSWEGDWRDAT